MTAEDFWKLPLEEKKAVYWVPPETYDPVTKGRGLSDEEKQIMRRLERVPSLTRDAFDRE